MCVLHYLAMWHEFGLKVHPRRAHEDVVVDLALEEISNTFRVRHFARVHVVHGVELLLSKGTLADLKVKKNSWEGDGGGTGDGGRGKRDPTRLKWVSMFFLFDLVLVYSFFSWFCSCRVRAEVEYKRSNVPPLDGNKLSPRTNILFPSKSTCTGPSFQPSANYRNSL